MRPANLYQALEECFQQHRGPATGSQPATSQLPSDSTPGDKYILIVEDNPTNQLVTRKLVQKLGYQAQVVADGQKALEYLQANSCDLVLMDCQMPVMDGYTATAELRRRPHLTQLPVIALTAHAMEGDRQKCLDAGMNDYLAKPLQPQSLKKILAQYLYAPEG